MASSIAFNRLEAVKRICESVLRNVCAMTYPSTLIFYSCSLQYDHQGCRDILLVPWPSNWLRAGWADTNHVRGPLHLSPLCEGSCWRKFWDGSLVYVPVDETWGWDKQSWQDLDEVSSKVDRLWLNSRVSLTTDSWCHRKLPHISKMANLSFFWTPFSVLVLGSVSWSLEPGLEYLSHLTKFCKYIW